MVTRRTGPTRTRPRAPTAGSRSGGPTTAPRLRADRVTRARPARRPVARHSLAGLDAERADPHPHRARQLLPVRVRPDRPALRPPGRARPVRDPLRRAQLGGPGRPPRRARLARRRAGARAVRDRRARACAATGSCRGRRASSTSRPPIAELLGCAPARRRHATSRARTATSRDRRARRRGRAAAARRRLPVRRHQPQRALRHGRARRGAERRPADRDGHRVRSRRDGGAARRSRSPTTRRSSPARIPGHHGILHNAWYDRAQRRAGHHQLAGHVAVGDGAPHAGRRVDPRRRAPHVARRVHRVGQRAVRHRRRLLDVRLLPPRRGAADPRATRSACRTPPSGSCARRRTTRGRRSSTTWASSRPSASGAATTATQSYPHAAVHVVQLHAHRLRDARGRPALGDRGRVGPRLRRAGSARCSTRSSAPACSTTPRSCSSPTTAWRRTIPRCSGDWDVALRDAGIAVPRRGLRLPLPRRGLERPQTGRAPDGPGRRPCRCRT